MSRAIRLPPSLFRLAALACLLLAGCATRYEPRGFFGAGFSEQKIDRDLWFVTFDASAFTPRERVRAYLMLRCAELTVQSGARYFAIIGEGGPARQRSTKPTLIDQPPFPLDRSVSEPVFESSHSARAAIQVFPERPDGVERLYDARDLIRQLAPTMRPD